MSGIVTSIKKPLGTLVFLVVASVFAGLTAMAALSGALTAALVNAAGLLTVIILIFIINAI